MKKVFDIPAKVIPKLAKVFRGSGNVFKDIGCKNPEKLLKEANKWLDSLSQCPHCYCMTYTIKGKCGKCKKEKKK